MSCRRNPPYNSGHPTAISGTITRPVNRAIIFAPNWLGDAVMALPAIADVRRGLPRATIAIAARQSVAPLFGMVPGIDEVITLADGVEKGVGTNPSFETAILLPNSF